MKKPLIAKFNKRILFQSSVKIDDNMGGFTLTWQDSFTRWGYVKASEIEQRNVANVNRFVANIILILRAETLISKSLRCVIDGNIYQITQLNQYKDLPDFLECELELVEGI
jgi:SPP1 family predicted phage head-tail adaptor